MQTYLLLVEDDPNLGQILQEYLEIKGYRTRLARDGEEAYCYFKEETFDLCILDVMLPRKDGFSLARDIRTIDKHLPIIFLTAKSLKDDTLEGLRLGADDYMTKPFSMEELLLRIRAVLRRSRPAEAPQAGEILRIGRYLFDHDKQLLNLDGQTQKLTSKESALLKLLGSNLNQTLERSIALKQIWHSDTYFNARSMDVYITKLRKYLRSDPAIEIINVHGTGFKLVVLNSLDVKPL